MATAKSNRPPGEPGSEDFSRTITERIEIERRRLQKASAVLTCLVYCVNHEADDVDAADVASVVIKLINRAVLALDSVKLAGQPSSKASAAI
jgi:hypothetical protein